MLSSMRIHRWKCFQGAIKDSENISIIVGGEVTQNIYYQYYSFRGSKFDFRKIFIILCSDGTIILYLFDLMRKITIHAVNQNDMNKIRDCNNYITQYCTGYLSVLFFKSEQKVNFLSMMFVIYFRQVFIGIFAF